jgi:hypothetical protein
VLLESVKQWIGVLSGREESLIREAPFVLTRLVEDRT